MSEIRKESGVYWLYISEDPAVELWYVTTPNGATRTFAPKDGRVKLGTSTTLTEPVTATLTPADVILRPMETYTFPAAAPPQFGSALAASRPRIAEATGAEDVATTVKELNDALVDSTRKIIRVKGQLVYPGSHDANVAAGPRLTKRGTSTSTHMLYGKPEEGDSIKGRIMFLGDYWHIRGLDVSGYNCVKIADVSDPAKTFRFLDIDHCRLHGSPASSIVSGWGTSSDIQVWDGVIDQRGMVGVGPTGLDPYCIYSGGPTSRLTYGSLLMLNGNGWSLHLFPKPVDVLYTACTMVGGIKRGGVLLSGARNAVGVGSIILASPQGAFEVHPSSANSGCAAYDMIGWQNKNGWWTPGYSVITNDNLLTADPLLDAEWRPRAGSPAKGHVEQARWPLLPPRDAKGAARVTADAGWLAAA